MGAFQTEQAESWPNAFLNFSLIPNDIPVLPKLPLKPLFQLYRRDGSPHH